MQWIPKWLSGTYGRIYQAYGTSPFASREAAESTQLEAKKLNLSLSRLAQSGWVGRVGKGIYVAVDPLVLFLAREDLATKVKNPQALQMVRVVLGETFRVYGHSLASVAVFGSLARGEWSETSDIDILVVADDLPENYSERLERARAIFDACARLRVAQWQGGGGYHLLDLVPLEVEELQRNDLFLLDMTRDLIILYDKGDVLSKRMADLKRKLAEKGVVRMETPSGKWYWDLKGIIA